jgi:hypothetical protein
MRLDTPINRDDLPKNESSFEPIPADWYKAKIRSAEVKLTKAGTGKYLNVGYDILGPSYQGRVVFGMITVQNSNQKAEEIGRGQLGDLMGSVGMRTLHDTDELVGKVLSVKVGVRKSEQYGDKNEVKAWRAVEGAALPPAQPSEASTQPAQDKPPW